MKHVTIDPLSARGHDCDCDCDYIADDISDDDSLPDVPSQQERQQQQNGRSLPPSPSIVTPRAISNDAPPTSASMPPDLDKNLMSEKRRRPDINGNTHHSSKDNSRTVTCESEKYRPPSSTTTATAAAAAAANMTRSANSSHLRIPPTTTTTTMTVPCSPRGPRTPNSVGGMFLRHSANASLASLGERLLERLEWRERIRHWTWTYFTMTMATGGIANVLYQVPFRFRGLYAIGTVFFLLNIVLFIINIIMISLRFYHHPETFRASILHPTERLFIPACVVSFGTILLNISQYGPHRTGHWLNDVIAVLFWMDCGLALLASMGVYLVMWSTQSFTISEMTPIWIFPAYPLLIIGPHAGVLSKTVQQEKALDIIIGGFTLQGIGFMVTLMIYSAFIYRLMTQKLPQEATRPGMFVSVGPCGFTVAGIIGMAEGAQRALPPGFMVSNNSSDPNITAIIIKIVASWLCLWLWGLAFWFFFISVGAHYSCVKRGRMTFTMSWFSYVFPNTALVTATFAIGRAFESRAIQVVGCVMTPLLIVVWAAVFGMMVRAIILKQILWPQRGEDKDEGGFRAPRMRARTLSV